MNEEELIKTLEREGYTDVRVCPVNSTDIPEEPHTHDVHTVHVIVEGELTLIDEKGSVTLRPGDRFEIPAGTTHIAKTGPKGCRFAVGVKVRSV